MALDRAHNFAEATDVAKLNGSVKEPKSSTTMKLRKSLVKPVMWQNISRLFGSSTRDRHARHI